MSFFSKFKIGNTSYDVKDANAGKSLALSGSDLQLKDASGTVRSTVTLPLGGNIDTVVGTFTASTDDYIITIHNGTMGVGKLVIIKPAANLSNAYLLSKTYNCASASSGIKIVPCFGNTESANNLNITKWSVSQTLFGYIFNYSSSRYYVNLFNCPTSYDKYVDNSNLTSVDHFRNIIVNSNAVVIENSSSVFSLGNSGAEHTPDTTKFITTADGKFFFIIGFNSEKTVNQVTYTSTNARKYKPTYYWSFTNYVANPKKVGTLEYDYTNKVFKLNGVSSSGSSYAESVTTTIFVIEGTLWTK